MENQIRQVLIGTPAHDGRVDAWYVNSLLETVRLCSANNIGVHPIFMCYDSLLPRARNDLIKLAVDSNIDDLVFIDGDQAWVPKDFLKLLGHEVDVVGGAVIKKTDHAELYNVKANYPITVNEVTGLMNVLSVGTGFLRLSKRAMAELYANSEPYTNEGKENRMMFEIKIIDGELYSEDTILCNKLKELSFDIWLDSSITCSHIGPKKWDGNFAQWYSNLKVQ